MKQAVRSRYQHCAYHDLAGQRVHPAIMVFIVVIALCLTGATAAAQSSSEPVNDTLTLDECVTIARTNSPELSIARHGIEAAKLDRRLAKHSRWPMFRLSGDAGYAPVSLNFGYDPAVSNGGELGARIVAEQPLYSGGRTGLEIKQAQTAISQQSLAWQQQDRALVYAVRLAFIDLLAAVRQHDLACQSVEQLSDYSDLVTDLNQSGRAKYADVLSARVELSRARIDSSTAALAVTSARLSLNRLVVLPDDVVVKPVGSLDSLLLAATDTTASIPSNMSAENLDISTARLDVRQSRLSLDLSRSEWKPTLSLTADAGVVTSRENLLMPPSERYRSVGYSVGLSLDMPLWDWGRRKTETARIRTEMQSAEDNVSLTQRNVNAEYRNTRLRLLDTRRRLNSLRGIIQTAEDSYLLTLAQYTDGNASSSEVLFAQQALIDTRRSEVDALSEIQSLKARLDMIARPEQEVRP